ncbi:M-Phase Inducer Phosphatase 2 [Manis pentadactyla]|nr:M-Phase Inducer Phosphatase 2 [Manis pentadactyla]
MVMEGTGSFGESARNSQEEAWRTWVRLLHPNSGVCGDGGLDPQTPEQSFVKCVWAALRPWTRHQFPHL